MKKIEAIVSPTKFEAAREGLKAAGIVGRLVVYSGLRPPPLLRPVGSRARV
jgi:hypothetical protein